MKKRVAVLFGGRSPEHDVSVVSALQVLSAIDASQYDAFPVYISPDGEWLVGDVLRERRNYLLTGERRRKAVAVTLDVTAGEVGHLLPKKTPVFGSVKPIEFDVAMPIFHGLYGEDGNVQGLFELIGVPYTGARTLASSIYMDKVATKRVLNDLEIPHLPYVAIYRPEDGVFVSPEYLQSLVKDLKFPCILKPSHLGSSIGVAKVDDVEELSSCLPTVFEFDDVAIVEPFVKNMVEYNVAVSNIGGETTTSAIERPKASDELLDFKQKYLSGGGKSGSKVGGGVKVPGESSEGMLSLTREINPDLNGKMEADIRAWSIKLFEALDGSGVPRIDFMSNSETGEIWMNEVNPIPGSLGYFLWEAATEPLLFTELLSGLIDEAFTQRRKRTLPQDPVPKDARLLKR